ncbi:MAG: hypothetical protein IJ583_10895 [Firmicutes bacterium]|nr:hypothetical protein [Bacillota bacterium]
MVDREKFQNKLQLQKTKNIISKIEGIQVIDYEKQDLFDVEHLRKIGYFSSDKIADAKISNHSSDFEIVDWIYNLAFFQIEQIWYLWVNGFLVKIKILNVRTAILNLWKNIDRYSKGFVLIDKNKSAMYVFGNDSRDEENYLFDKYTLLQ